MKSTETNYISISISLSVDCCLCR